MRIDSILICGRRVHRLGALCVGLAPRRPREVGQRGVYTADAGETRGDVYKEQCAPAMATISRAPVRCRRWRAPTSANWQGKTVGDLFEKTHTTMPATAPGSLTPAAGGRHPGLHLSACRSIPPGRRSSTRRSSRCSRSRSIPSKRPVSGVPSRSRGAHTGAPRGSAIRAATGRARPLSCRCRLGDGNGVLFAISRSATIVRFDARGACSGTLFLGSSMAEHPAVNRRVAGSSPARGANLFKQLMIRATGRWTWDPHCALFCAPSSRVRPPR